VAIAGQGKFAKLALRVAQLHTLARQHPADFGHRAIKSLKPAFEQTDHVFDVIPFAADSFLVNTAEAALADVGVIAFELLFFFERTRFNPQPMCAA
jgi:hypothetical protein